MNIKLEDFEALQERITRERRIVTYFEAAVERLETDDRVFIGSSSAGDEVRASFAAAVARELEDRRTLVNALEDQLISKLK